jgi:hypothetical protein
MALTGALRAAPPSSPEVRLSYNVKAGDVVGYQMSMEGTTNITLGEQTQQTALTNDVQLTQKVAAVDPATGEILFQTTIDRGSMAINAISSPLPMVGQMLETRMKPTGQIVSSSGMDQHLQNMQLVFPDKPVKVGTTWSIEVPPSAQVPVPLTMTYIVTGFEKFKGRDCVKLSSSIMSGKESQMEGVTLDMSAQGTVYFDHVKGQMVSNDVKSDMTMTLKRVIQGAEATILTHMLMRVKLALVK